eukprot:scaffold9782_cov58-Phaeocystis_antarctica.AAC.3
MVWRRPHNPRRQRLEPLVVPPLRLGHLGALLLLQHAEGICRGPCPALRVHGSALHDLEEPLHSLYEVPRVGEHCTEVVIRLGQVGPQGDGLAVGLGCFARVLLRAVPRALRHQLHVLVARLRGDASCLLRGLAILLLRRPTILPPLPRFAGQLTAEVCRRQLLIAALVADRVLLTVVVHVRRQPEAADASEAQRHVRRRAALLGSGRRGDGLGSLALGLQRRQCRADLLGGRSQVWLLLPQLGEQRLEAEVGVSHSQATHGLEECIGRAGFAHALMLSRRRPTGFATQAVARPRQV